MGRPGCTDLCPRLLRGVFRKFANPNPAHNLISQVSHQPCRMSLWKRLCGKAMGNLRAMVPQLLLVHREHLKVSERITKHSYSFGRFLPVTLIFDSGYAKKKVPDHVRQS